MNKWAEKSVRLAGGKAYLDRLLEVYPPEEIGRELSVEKESPRLKLLFEQKKCEDLIAELIRLRRIGFKFPVENPYVSFLTYSKKAIRNNPKTVQKICAALYESDYDTIKRRLEAPKKASRRIGPMFRNWLRKKFLFTEIADLDDRKEITFLNGGDAVLRSFAESRLGCALGELSKGLDFIAKVRHAYIIGTAKFLTDFGGTQFNQFYEAIRLVREVRSPKNVVKVAIVDGVVWLGGKMLQVVKNLRKDEFCLSALLLEDFLNEINER